MKKYRVNESEHFNLYSMHDKLKCIEIDMQEAPAHTYTDEQWDEVQERISEVEELMEKAYCVGALVDWTTLKRIREIKEERQLIAADTEDDSARFIIIEHVINSMGYSLEIVPPEK